MKLKTDLVIMGSGMAGISAADAALARGKKVIVFEKKPYQGGSSFQLPDRICQHSKRQGISERSISFVI